MTSRASLIVKEAESLVSLPILTNLIPLVSASLRRIAAIRTRLVMPPMLALADVNKH